MSADLHPRPDQPAPSDRSASRPPSGGYARLARRISAWTSRALISLVILVAGLAFGRQVIHWWGEGKEPAAPAQAALDVTPGLGDPAVPHTLRFGNQGWTVGCQSVSGDRDAAAELLRARCREAVAGASLPTDPAGPGEQALLAELSEADPVDRQAGRWALYARDQGLPSIVGVGQAAGADTPPEGSELAATGRRVVTWAVAIPAGPDAWTLYTFRPEQDLDGSAASLPEIPLPPGADHLLSLRAAGGAAVTGFRGEAGPDRWVPFYDDWFARNGWQAAAKWRRIGPSLVGRFTGPAGGPGTVDVRFGPDPEGGYCGLLIVAPAAATEKQAGLPHNF